MKTAHISLTLSCNLGCVMCSAPPGSDGWVPADDEALAGRFASMRKQGVERVVLTGGEPTLDPRILARLQMARAHGFAEVAIETNGTLASGANAAKLAGAGLTDARVNLPSHKRQV